MYTYIHSKRNAHRSAWGPWQRASKNLAKSLKGSLLQTHTYTSAFPREWRAHEEKARAYCALTSERERQSVRSKLLESERARERDSGRRVRAALPGPAQFIKGSLPLSLPVRSPRLLAWLWTRRAVGDNSTATTTLPLTRAIVSPTLRRLFAGCSSTSSSI